LKDIWLEWFIARRYLASRKGARFLSLITLIAIGGVTVGVMALIVVTSVMSGLQRDLRDKILGTNPHIWLTTYGERMELQDWEDAATRTRATRGVAAAAPFVQTEVVLTSPGSYTEAGILRGVAPDTEGEPVTDIIAQIRSGEYELGPTASGLPPLLLGDQLAERFSAYPGRVLNVLALDRFQVNPMGMLQPTIRQFEVVGRFRTGMYEYDHKFMYTTLEAAQEITGLGDSVTGLEIRVPEPMQASSVARALEDEFGFPHRALDWQTMNSSLFSALQLEKMAMGIILLLIVVVAAFNIISTLVMVVTDKTREIGILKSMGLHSKQVQRIFMLQGVVIGVIGSLLGAIGGLTLTWLLDRYQFIQIPGDIYFVDRLPVAFDPLEIGIILVASLTISFLATIYPARQAARLFPVEAIRHE
jgi:lipoprotein-releasing system permease protein